MGFDRNHNGVLDDAEVEHTEFVCAGAPELWIGDFNDGDWQDPSKVAALQRARVVLGSLSIPARGLTVLPKLELVSENLTVTAHTAVVAPALRSVDGSASIVTATDSAPSFPALDRIAGTLSLGGPGGRGGLIDAPLLRELGELAIAPGAASELTLLSLQTVTGNIDIAGSLAGLHLDHVTSIGGGITLAPQSALRLALPSLTTLGGSIESRLSPVTTVDLPVLATVGGGILLDGMNSLIEVSLPAVSEIHGNFIVASVPVLTTLTLGAWAVDGSVYVSDATMLRALSATQLRFVNTDLIVQLSGVEQLEFPLLSFVRGSILMGADRALRSVTLPMLDNVASISIYDSLALASVAAPTLEDIGSLFILGSDAPLTLDFHQLTTARSSVDLRNLGLSDLSGLRGLTRSGELRLDHVSQLQDLGSLTRLRELSGLVLNANPALISLAGLDRIVQLAGRLDVTDNAALTSLAGLEQVTSVGTARFQGNTVIAGLELPGLLSVNGALRIIGMPALTTLSGLDTLISVRGPITIEANAQLSSAEIDAFLDRF